MTAPLSTPSSAQDTSTRFSALGRRAVILCALVAFLDGFDTQAIGPAGRAIAASLNMPMAALGPVFSASQIGFLLGALGFSSLGDRFGRKRMLVVTTAIFALCSLGTALAPTYEILFAFRLLAGLGLGGASPNFISLASEYAPPAQRARVVTTLWAAVPLGGMVASFASAYTLPHWGWRAIFHIGCIAPLVLAPILMRWLPESRETRPVAEKRPAPAVELFSAGRAVATTWLWLASFMSWTMIVVTAFWTPPLLQKAGWTAPAAASVLALNNAGGVLGALLLGWTLTKIRPHWALIGALVASAASIAAIGLAASQHMAVAVAAALAGFSASASGGALLAVSASLYPPDARATGVGWALGFGRIGSVVGPMLIGLLVAAQWPVANLYFLIASAAVLAAVLIFLLSRTRAFAEAQAPVT